MTGIRARLAYSNSPDIGIVILGENHSRRMQADASYRVVLVGRYSGFVYAGR